MALILYGMYAFVVFCFMLVVRQRTDCMNFNLEEYKGLRGRLRVSTKRRMEEVRNDDMLYICDTYINCYVYRRWGEEKTEKEQSATFPVRGRDTVGNRSRW